MKACSIIAQLGLVCIALAAPTPNDIENRQFDGIPTDILGPILSGLPEIPGFSIPVEVPTGLPSLPLPTGLAEALGDLLVLAEGAGAPEQPDPSDLSTGIPTLPTGIPTLPTPSGAPEITAIPEIPEIPEIPLPSGITGIPSL